jgi:hypothetical protein
MSENKKSTYQDCSKIIDSELLKRRRKWFLNSVPWIDYDDVCQIIRAHIHKKWHQWDQSRPLEPWLNRIVSNQLKNILRNNYGNYVRPCLNCPFNQSDGSGKDSEGLCGFTSNGTQCNECPLYAKWEKTKKSAYNTKMTLALDHHQKEAEYITQNNTLDIDNSIDRINVLMEKKLPKKKYIIYKLLFIDNVDEDAVAERVGYKSNEKNRKAGYKQLQNLKKEFKQAVLEIIQQEDIVIVNYEKPY